MEEFAKVLADDKNAFAVSSEKFTLKKSANNELFSHIKLALDQVLRDPYFKRKNKELYFKKKYGKILNIVY